MTRLLVAALLAALTIHLADRRRHRRVEPAAGPRALPDDTDAAGDYGPMTGATSFEWPAYWTADVAGRIARAIRDHEAGLSTIAIPPPPNVTLLGRN